jgi:hypothetical protein
MADISLLISKPLILIGLRWEPPRHDENVLVLVILNELNDLPWQLVVKHGHYDCHVPSQRIRIANTLMDAVGEAVALKKGAVVHFVIRPKLKGAN